MWRIPLFTTHAADVFRGVTNDMDDFNIVQFFSQIAIAKPCYASIKSRF
jgi:hypothetical protein